MDDKTVYYHLHLRRRDILRERDNDRLAAVASQAQPTPDKPKFYAVYTAWIGALLKRYYTAKLMPLTPPPSPLPASGEGE